MDDKGVKLGHEIVDMNNISHYYKCNCYHDLKKKNSCVIVTDKNAEIKLHILILHL